ncbi:MAG: hypothetical protein HYX32_11750 [Actinobacteria bacterium]|nr:hypothetical protein [Actinomycetota bacterium]
MGDSEMVQIQLRRADDLGRLLAQASGDYLTMTSTVERYLDVARARSTASLTLLKIAGTVADESRRVRAVVAEVRDIESGLAENPYDDLRIDHTPYDSPFASDEDAVAAAQAANDAYRRGDLREFTRLNELWSTEGAYAAELAQEFTANDVLDVLGRYDEVRRQIGISVDARITKAAMVNVLQSLSVASRMGAVVPSFNELADEIDRESAGDDPRRYKPLAYLFEPDVQWSTSFLVEAGTRFVLPANRDVLAHGGDGSLYALVGDGTDTRALVLDKIAADRDASAAVLRNDLDELLPSRLSYGDSGKALGKVMVSGTSPDAAGGSVRALEVIDWVGDHRDLQPEAKAVLGKVAAPYLGSFRDLSYKTVPLDDPISPLNPVRAQAYLDYAAETIQGRDDLQDALVRWSDRELGQMAAAGYDASKLQVIGNVAGNVATGRYRGGLKIAMDVDQSIKDEKKVVNAFVSVIADKLEFGLGPVATLTSSELIDRGYAQEQLSNIYARDASKQLALQGIMLDTLAVQKLWQSRGENRVFDSLPPPAPLVAPDGRLRTFGELTDPSDQVAMRRWLNQLDAAGVVRLGSIDRGSADSGVGP